ncbi:MAG: gamma-glutamyl-gamma-aminobutyrate hydrolase family protein [Clostridia bacterium]|nr:gamma-glutamyl-gamma-aminobutyrate hydrolase family protein [Clostridia bacterium]
MAERAVIGVMPLYDDEKDSIWMLPGYLDGLSQAGLTPFILSLHMTAEEIAATDDFFDGYLFTGGHDIDPALYGTEKSEKCGSICADRDRLEKAVFELAYKKDKPMLGICRGHQLINALLGGSLYQDLPSERPSETSHVMTVPYNKAVHTVNIDKNSSLYGILNTETLGVNSYHHQAVKDTAPSLSVMALSEDGIAEALEDRSKSFLWTVQWHPEFSYKTDDNSRKIFSAFAEACMDYRRRK